MSVRKMKLLAAVVIITVSILACGSGSGVEVNTQSDNQESANSAQPEQTQPTATKPVGTSRSNPAPAGSEVVTDDMAFEVLGFTRPATDIVMSGNQFNTAPEGGQEYIFVNLQVTCQKSSDEQCNFSTFSISLLGSSGVKRDAELFVAGVDGLLEGGDFYGGATLSGNIPFIIDTDESDLLIVYEPFLGDTFYLAIQ